MFCLKPLDLNNFSLKLMKYLMFPNSHFCVKSEIELPQKTQALHLQHQSPSALHDLVVVKSLVLTCQSNR